MILTFILILAFAGLEATFALWSERAVNWAVAQNGYIFSFIETISTLIKGTLIDYLSREISEVAMVTQGFPALGIGLSILPFTSNLLLLLITLIMIAHGFMHLLTSTKHPTFIKYS